MKTEILLCKNLDILALQCRILNKIFYKITTGNEIDKSSIISVVYFQKTFCICHVFEVQFISIQKYIDGFQFVSKFKLCKMKIAYN